MRGVCRFSFRFTGFFFIPPPFGSLKKNVTLLNPRDVPPFGSLKKRDPPPLLHKTYAKAVSCTIFKYKTGQISGSSVGKIQDDFANKYLVDRELIISQLTTLGRPGN